MKLKEKQKKYKFELGFTFIRYDVRDDLGLSNHEYAIAHALSFVGRKNNVCIAAIENGYSHRTNYRPDIKRLAKDLGFSVRTIYRSLSILREKHLVESDCLEATELWVSCEHSKKPKHFLFDIVQHGHREQLGLKFIQYLICTIYDRLSKTQEWVTLDKKEIAKTVGISVKQVHRIIKQMVSKKLMETQLRRMSNGQDFLDVKMTEQWYTPQLSTK